RYLQRNKILPPPDAVRIEEFINYFRYDYPTPQGEDPFTVHAEVAGCPWNPEHRLLRIGLKGLEIDNDQRPSSNLVFLLDVSGSMSSPDKLPLLRRSLKMMLDYLGENDRVAIVVYAGASGLVLSSTPGSEKAKVVNALDHLQAGGSTNGGAGIKLAYREAADNFISGGTNRVILCTDGDFNVGATSQGELHRLIEEKAKSKVFLTVLGFGTGNLKDSTMEMLADKGNGNYGYIDSLQEARKILVDQMGSTLVTIAKDVKIQVEFNPLKVSSYRLIGYENRVLAARDFNDDKKDAGEIGAGHTVTALYEFALADGKAPVEKDGADPLEFQEPRKPSEAAEQGSLALVKLRYKQPEGDTSKLLKFHAKDAGGKFDDASKEFQFASSVAAFGMLLRGSAHKGESNYDFVLETAEACQGENQGGYRAEFLALVKIAKKLAAK
ncbi:MAG: VWA domain-containing protein, partial [Planctomycetales bacterium]